MLWHVAAAAVWEAAIESTLALQSQQRGVKYPQGLAPHKEEPKHC